MCVVGCVRAGVYIVFVCVLCHVLFACVHHTCKCDWAYAGVCVARDVLVVCVCCSCMSVCLLSSYCALQCICSCLTESDIVFVHLCCCDFVSKCVVLWWSLCVCVLFVSAYNPEPVQ